MIVMLMIENLHTNKRPMKMLLSIGGNISSAKIKKAGPFLKCEKFNIPLALSSFL